ncbi:MAG: HAD-IA family hydrolase [Nitrososphaerota archaeon]|nr:HAD-IA family hydrolase [Nitrososphaerota archaeon]
MNKSAPENLFYFYLMGVSQMINVAIFDYGGTLVRSREPWDKVKPRAVQATYKVFLERGLKIPPDDFISREASLFNELGKVETEESRDIPDSEKYDRFVADLFPDQQDSWKKETSRRATEAFWRVVVENYAVRDDAYYTLERLKTMGFRMAVISNHHNHEALLSHLNLIGLDRFFFPILSSCQFSFRKPDPRIFKVCLDKLEVRPENAAYIGDTPNIDVKGAKLTGMKSILIRDSHIDAEKTDEPDRMISNLNELPDLLLEL